MGVDIYLRHKYEKYGCGYHSLAGYSKENDCASPRYRVSSKLPAVPPQPHGIVTSNSGTAQAAYNSVQELSQKIDVLEDALKSNVSATNQNERLIVDQIVALKKELAGLQSSAPAEQASPPASTSVSGVRIGAQ